MRNKKRDSPPEFPPLEELCDGELRDHARLARYHALRFYRIARAAAAELKRRECARSTGTDSQHGAQNSGQVPRSREEAGQ